MRGRWITKGVLAAALFAALLGPFSLAGCSPDAAERRERAERYLAEGRAQEALLELRSALQAEPNDAQTNFRIAEIAEEIWKGSRTPSSTTGRPSGSIPAAATPRSPRRD